MKRLLRSLPIAALLLALLVAGCAAQRAKTNEASYDSARAPRPAAMATAAPAMPQAAPAPASGEALKAIEAERKIILTANLSLTVRETEQTVATIKDMVVARGGFVSSSSVWRQDNILRGGMVVRVPAEQMEAFLAEVKKLAVQVNSEQSGGQDVTEEYIDIEAQLKNLEATETELRELLTTVREKTGKAEDIMAIYRELTNVRGDIERIKGRMQYIDRSVQLATVSLDLSERAPEPIGQPGWQPLQTVRRALNGLVETSKFLVDALIYIVLLVVPLLAVPAFVIWLLLHLLRRRGEKKKAAALSKPDSLS
ncbi:MAG TPA: DUF4349 domain-containing protein [Anaerolineae bacterium]|nr:DUF4349 domain-containing protein [Anaerolineae bacterium]HOQ98444.1 DUF4349 domain-containing protein [Anaerolineae bacterium]HPL26727.1 DUF4349 domain-containing protein [Anaerolineae bacterium]